MSPDPEGSFDLARLIHVALMALVLRLRVYGADVIANLGHPGRPGGAAGAMSAGRGIGALSRPGDVLPDGEDVTGWFG